MNNNRLKKILEYIEPTAKLADVGCDHGYLAVEAINKGVSFVELIDNKEGPLQSAINNLKYYETKAEIVYSLSSGLSSICEKVDTVAICGMGGDLIKQIINADIDVARRMKKLILQANSKNNVLRKFLFENKFNIIDETVVLDKGKIYEIIICTFSNTILDFNEKDVIFGPVLRVKKDKLFLKKWESRLLSNEKILKNQISEDKKNEVETENKLIKEVLYES